MRSLFYLAPDEFYLTGVFMTDEGRYERNLIKRNEIIRTLDSCIAVCEKAISKGDKVLHNGI